jgi:hypothetical protein
VEVAEEAFWRQAAVQVVLLLVKLQLLKEQLVM